MEPNTLKEVHTLHTAEEVANCLLHVADEQENSVIDPDSNKEIKEGVTNLKLQKLLYFAQAAHLAVYDKPLIAKEEFEAWSLGPVIASLYHKYKENNKASIPVPEKDCSDPELKAFLTEIWKIFGKYTASELVQLSHRQGTPWQEHYHSGNKNEKIPNEEIKQFYRAFFRVK